MFAHASKKRFPRAVAMTVGAVLTLGLAGCAGGNTEATGDSDEPVELEIWIQRDEFLPTGGFDEFEAANPGITVKTVTVPAEEQISTFLRSAASGDAPDVLMPTTDLWPPLAEQGLLYDMTELLAQWEEENPEEFEDAAAGIAFGTAQDGVPYGIGIAGAPTWMTYRADWFQEAGIETPETYEELLEAARTIKAERPDVTPFGIVGARAASPAAKFLTLFYRMGGTHENGVPQFDSEAGIFLLEYYQTLVKEKLAHPDTLAWTSGETRGSFIEGIEGMTPISQNIYPEINEALEYGTEWALLPDLHREGHEDDATMTFRAITALMAANTEYPEESALLIRYLAGPDYGVDLSTRYQPSLNAAVGENPEYLEVAPWVSDLAPHVAEAQPLPAHAKAAELYEIVHDMKQEAIGNPDADAAEIAKKAQERMSSVVAE